MAITAEQQTDAITLIVGMTGVAPAAATLEAIVALVEGGTEGAALADFVAAHPAFSGDYGLYPAYVPDAIFATNWLTDMIGDEVTETVLAAAIAEMTADLNSGTGRGAAMFAAVSVLTAETPDADFADAAAALANKATVAEYYATNSEAEENLEAMAAALDGVTSDAATVDDATDAIDAVIAAAADVNDLIDLLDAANAAKTAFLAGIDVDDNPLTKTTDTALDTAGDDATTAVDGIIAAELAGAGAGDYTAASAAQKAAYISDTQASQAATSLGTATALAATLNDTAGTGSVTGLDAAIAGLDAAIDASDAAIEAAALTDVALTEAEGNYDVLNGNGVGTTTADASGLVPGLIIASGSTLVLSAGVTETTDPGVTALLAASLANEAADAAAAAALTGAASALALVENLDPNAARIVDLGLVDALMGTFITSATAGAPTDAEMAANQAALDAGQAQLNADLAALAFNADHATTLADQLALTTAAVTAGFLAAGDKVAIDAAWAAAGDASHDDQAEVDVANAAAQVALTTNSEGVTYAAAVALYAAEGTVLAGGDSLNTALTLAPLALAADNANSAHNVSLLAQATFAAALATEAELLTAIDDRDDLDDAIADATAAFADAGYAAPVTLDSAVKAATAADDLFMTGGIDSQIISFADDDVLYVGDDLVLNTDTTAGDNGNNTVEEVWITGTTSAVITIETSEFGSNAAVPETYSITLTGVAAADVSLVDGFIVIA